MSVDNNDIAEKLVYTNVDINLDLVCETRFWN